MRRLVTRVLETPYCYDAVQKLLGGDRGRRLIGDLLRAELGGAREAAVLDVGCGTALFRDCFGGSYYGLDCNLDYLGKAGRSGGGRFVGGEAAVLPFRSEAFAVVFTLGVLHHLDAAGRAGMLAELGRVCRPGGRIVIVDGVVPSNRLNVVGYAIARLDRGPYKMPAPAFDAMIGAAYPSAAAIRRITLHNFPSEFRAVIVRK